jgi:hypothetical protein
MRVAVAGLGGGANAVAGEKSYRFTPQQLLDKVKVFDSIVTSARVWVARRSNFRERVAVMPAAPRAAAVA